MTPVLPLRTSERDTWSRSLAERETTLGEPETGRMRDMASPFEDVVGRADGCGSWGGRAVLRDASHAGAACRLASASE